jgi:hypothetical protein
MGKPTKKKKSTTSSSNRKGSTEMLLEVEVLQHGAVQATGAWFNKGLFRRRISFGVSRRADLTIPFANLPGKVEIFEIRDGKVYVVLDPRTEGFVNRGREFADVREYLRPRGAIAAIASIDDPLLLELHSGSRGSLKIYGYEVIFKYLQPVKKRVTKKEIGAGRDPFGFAPTSISLERNAPWIAALAVAVAFVPFAVWLLRSYEKPELSIQDLPQDVLERLVDRGHYALLPRLLDDNFPLDNWAQREGGVERDFGQEADDKRSLPGFQAELAPIQAAMVLRDLQQRWRSAEIGEPVGSGIHILKKPYVTAKNLVVKPKWTLAGEEFRRRLSDRRASDWFFRAQAEYPRPVLGVSGGESGSFRTRLKRRLENIHRMRKALVSLIRTEQNFIYRYYKDELNYYGPTDPPYVGDVFIRPKYEFVGKRPSNEFQFEVTRYLEAEALARSEDLGWSHVGGERDGEAPASTLWLRRDGVIEPDWNGSVLGTNGVEAALVQNARYALGTAPLPPAPLPTPRIDRMQVEYVLVSHKEEIRACYEAALRRNHRAAGTVRMQWTIDLRGRVRDPRVVQSEISDPALTACLGSRILGWTFPRPVNGQVSFEYPFQFQLRPR